MSFDFASRLLLLLAVVSPIKLVAQTNALHLAHANEPRLFAPGVISTEDDEVNGALSPDGRDYYFARVMQYTTFPRLGILFVSHYLAGRWSDPEVLPFSGGQNYDTLPRLSPDGQRLYFTSSRLPAGKKARLLRIWMVTKTAGGWSDPEAMPSPINADDSWNWGASFTRDGTVYFTSDRAERQHPQLYRSKFVDGKYAEPEKLGPEINSEFNDYEAFVSPDESLLAFSSSGLGAPDNKNRPETIDGHGYQYPRGDLYISKNKGGHWTPARHLAKVENTEAEESAPSFTADGRYLFFSSERSPYTVPTAHPIKYAEFQRNLHSISNGHGNIYYISVDAIGGGQ